MSEAALLTPDELDRRQADLLRAREARRAPYVGPTEAKLLARINAGPDPDTWAEYRRLRAARDAGALTPADHRELIRLTKRLVRRLEQLDHTVRRWGLPGREPEDFSEQLHAGVGSGGQCQ